MNLRTLLIALAITAGFVWYTSKKDHNFATSTVPSWTEAPTVHSAGLSSDELNNIDVYKNSQPAVVYITSTVLERNFFGMVTQAKGIGSGFIISTDGQILTNNHVVSGSSELEVTLTDKSRHKATIVMRMPNDDLALIRIDPQGKKLPVLRLGDSDAVQVGQKVLAIGNPFGLSGTLTTGIISALDRTIQGDEQNLEGLLQTDAAINQGNSGGPLLDSMGNVIGIDTAIYGPNGGSVGIGFAMPINRAKRMLEDFKNGRRPAEPQIGIQTSFLYGDWPRALDLPDGEGLLIERVQRGSPADRAGLKGADRRVRVGNFIVNWGGDYITQVDGKPVKNQDDVTQATRKKHAGEAIELTIIRGGRSMKVTVTLTALDSVV
jgi:S1-C subfamily serine protease